jgi:glucose/mannose transport system permease protein
MRFLPSLDVLGGSPASRVVVAVAVGVALTCYVLTIGWTFAISLTASTFLPEWDFVGFARYERLFGSSRWQVAFANMFWFGIPFIAISLLVGTVLAILIDQNVQGEGLMRTVFLYPLALSFIVVGLIWQWVLEPNFGLQTAVRGWGWEGFTFDWIARSDRVIFTLVLAAVWHSSGLVMAIMLAGLRGVEREIWKATQVDGIPPWRVYVSVVLPMLRPMAMTCVVLLAISVVKSYELVVAMTDGGPGNASDLPSRFVMQTLFERENLSTGSAGAIVMMASVLAILAPYFILEMRSRRT